MKPELYLSLKEKIIKMGYSNDVDWADDLKPCTEASGFFCEYVFVVVNSGMKAQIARGIYNKIMKALNDGSPVSDAFGHPGKRKAILHVLSQYHRLFEQYQEAEDKLEFLKSLPWIGDITKYHLAKNLGHDVVKPDRHLVRIAKKYKTTPTAMCQKLADRLSEKLVTVDTVIWRAANLGLI